MRLGRYLALASVVTAVTAMSSPGCGSSGLVGGNCASGLTNCSNICLNLQIDQYNCGSCGHVCQSGVSCIQGRCGGINGEIGGGSGYGGEGGGGGHYHDGSAGVGASPSDAQGDHVVEFDAKNQGGATSGGGASIGGSNSGGSSAVDACTPPYNDALHCGDCTTVCPSDKPVCAPAAGSFECRPVCDLPLVNCSGTCADMNSDPTNCGTCGNNCPSGACQTGTCVGVQAGDFVAICMNYRSAANAQTTLLLGNSVFLPRVANVRILAYDQYAEAAVTQQVDTTIAGAALGRQYSISRVSNSADVPTRLSRSNYDVFLVYEQPNAPPGELSNIGSIWSKSLESFSYVGGAIVMLDGGQGVREMSQLFTSTTLLSVDSEVGLSSGTLLKKAVQSDSVVQGMFSPFACHNDTCVFETSVTPDADTSFVVTELANDAGIARPVVVHITRTAPQH